MHYLNVDRQADLKQLYAHSFRVVSQPNEPFALVVAGFYDVAQPS
jgi:hypothetical protein